MCNEKSWSGVFSRGAVGAVLIAGTAMGGCFIEEDERVATGDVATGDVSAESADADATSASLRRIDLKISSFVLNYDVAAAAGNPSDPVNVVLTIDPNVLVGSISPDRPALTSGALRLGSRLTINNRGSIIGAGGHGGSGGNGGSGGAANSRACGRDGGPGGVAIALTVPARIATDRGFIFGGGGGGGGMSGCNQAAGGGGGAGSIGGDGGAGATSLSEQEEIAFCGQDNGYRVGAAGAAGSLFGRGGGGERSLGAGGAGGAFGVRGADAAECIPLPGGLGGAAGAAVERNGNALAGIADGAYDTGAGKIRGPVR
jgi:hypothetical protein